MTQKNDAEIIKKLRKDLKKQLGITKYLFFRSEYAEIKHILKQNDDDFLSYVMNKELNLYTKSIIICTTGPIEVCSSLFGNYIVPSEEITNNIQSYSFNHYNLQKYFKSQNSIPLHENPLRMLKFLGVKDGELNDSSWLDAGRLLQEERVKKLEIQQQTLELNLPQALLQIKETIHKQQAKLAAKTLFKKRCKTQVQILAEILHCFDMETNEFDVDQFKTVLAKTPSRGMPSKLIQNLAQLSHNAVVFGLTLNRKIKLA